MSARTRFGWLLLACLVLAARTAGAQEARLERPAQHTVVRGLAAGGLSTASLFGISSTAAHIEAGLGVRKANAFIPLTVNAELGQSPNGLSMGEVTLGAGVQWVLGRVRLGGGIDVGYGWVGRARTSVGPHIGMYALDAFALATVDLVDLGEQRGLYLGVRPTAGVRWGESFFSFSHDAGTWRGAALLGFRL